MKTSAFTLIEIVVVIFIIAILAVVAVASYRHYILVSNRSDAIQTLLSIQLAEEKYRTHNVSYGALADVWGGVTATENGDYTLSISNLSATSYSITATAIGNQVEDTTCATMTLTYSNGTTTKTPATCWGDD